MDGVIRIYGSDGTLFNNAYATGLGHASFEIGPGNTIWGSDVYAINSNNGQLLRFDSQGISTQVGCGFTDLSSSLAFGPDGAVYVSIPTEDRIVRIIPEPATLSLLALGGLALIKRR